jgi:hypothetical protein
MNHTRAMVGDFDEDIEGKLRKYSDNFSRLPSLLESGTKYRLSLDAGGDRYSITVSQGWAEGGFADYDIMISVTGPDKGMAEEIMRDIEEKTRLKLREPPELLQELFDKVSGLVNHLEGVIERLYRHTIN